MMASPMDNRPEFDGSLPSPVVRASLSEASVAPLSCGVLERSALCVSSKEIGEFVLVWLEFSVASERRT